MRTSSARARALVLLSATVLVAGPVLGPGVLAQEPSDVVGPVLSARREILLLGAGGGLVLAGLLLDPPSLEVPAVGLDPSGILWGWDRSVLGNTSTSAGSASDWTRNAAMALPIVVGFAFAADGDRWEGLFRRGVVYAEAMGFSIGVSRLGKRALERARPYAFLPAERRPVDEAYDVTRERTFYSMPSGHSAAAWTGASAAVTEHLLARTGSHWLERFGVGFLGGGLAGSTAALRVEAGQHFPSDVLAGAGLGAAAGVVLPLVHRGGRPVPAFDAWLPSLAGVVSGSAVGVLLSR